MGQAPSAGVSLHAGDPNMGSCGLNPPGAWLQPAGAGGLGTHGRSAASVDEVTCASSTGMAADQSTAAPTGASAAHGAGRGIDAGGSGAIMMMLDDPWEQLFGPEGWQL